MCNAMLYNLQEKLPRQILRLLQLNISRRKKPLQPIPLAPPPILITKLRDKHLPMFGKTQLIVRLCQVLMQCDSNRLMIMLRKADQTTASHCVLSLVIVFV